MQAPLLQRLEPDLAARLVGVLPPAADGVVIIEEVCVRSVPEGQRLDDLRVFKGVTLIVFHLRIDAALLLSDLYLDIVDVSENCQNEYKLLNITLHHSISKGVDEGKFLKPQVL